MDNELKLQMLREKLNQLRKQPYGSNTDQMLDVQRQIKSLEGSSPVSAPGVAYRPEPQGPVERINKVKAAQFQKGLNEGPDIMENLSQAGDEVAEGYKRIRSIFNNN
jgi:hypothetical protein